MVPNGQVRLPFYDYVGERAGTLLCSVEVMMVAFTTGRCRVRGVILEAGLGRSASEPFGNKDTTLTPEILALIRR